VGEQITGTDHDLRGGPGAHQTPHGIPGELAQGGEHRGGQRMPGHPGQPVAHHAPEQPPPVQDVAVIALDHYGVQAHARVRPLQCAVDVVRLWFPHHVLEARTRENYTYLLNRYILPELGDIRMVELLPSHVREWVVRMQQVQADDAALEALNALRGDKDLADRVPLGASPAVATRSRQDGELAALRGMVEKMSRMIKGLEDSA